MPVRPWALGGWRLTSVAAKGTSINATRDSIAVTGIRETCHQTDCGFRIQAVMRRVWGVGLMVWVSGSAVRVVWFVFCLSGLRFRVLCFGSLISGFGKASVSARASESHSDEC